MKKIKRQLRSGFAGLEIMIPLIAFPLIAGALARSVNPTASGRQPPSATTQVTKETPAAAGRIRVWARSCEEYFKAFQSPSRQNDASPSRPR